MIMGSSVEPSLRSCALADVLSDKKIMGAGAENGMTNGIARTDRTDTAINPFNPWEEGNAGY